MRKSKFTKSQKLEILAKWDAGTKIDDLCREHQVRIGNHPVNRVEELLPGAWK